jgi:NAD-dependent deacetylase
MKKLIILSGAGMSAESGISTFRDSGGLWEQYKIEEVATPEAYMANPQLVHHFYNLRRNQLLDAQPNEGHKALVKLEQQFDIRIITQNVDNLHERAGSKSVLHLHGELMKMRSTGPGEEIYEVEPTKIEFSPSDLCPKGYPLRPHIVWFGEMVPEYDNAVRIVKQADILLIIGTSMQVYPAAGLLHHAAAHVPVYLIDPNHVSVSHHKVQHIRKGASEGIPVFTEMLLKN